jgi:type VI secretion system protein ImpG
MRDDLLFLYERELDYLRNSAVMFAKKHPKVAARLAIEPNQCTDPHTERLIEAFAFLAARVHLKMDDEFPEITEGLMAVVYPQLVRPIPSMTVAEFQPDPEKGRLTGALKIKRETKLFSKTVDGIPCTFRTCYETTLWPLSVTAAQLSAPARLQPAVKTLDSAWAVRLELRCAKDVEFPTLNLDKLRFYLDGESGLVNILYEMLFSRLNRILVRDLTPGSRRPPVTLPASALSAVGFSPDEGMIPYPASSFAGHRLLMEYFAFPEKFHFVDLSGLRALGAAGFKDAVEIVFLFSDIEGAGRVQRLELELSKKTFRLGCSPVANLFTTISEPIALNQRSYEYTINPDVRRPYAIEVFSVDEVKDINTNTQKIRVYEPFYSLRHSARKEDRPCFWLARRRPSNRPNDEGTDVSLSFVDLSTSIADPEFTSLSVQATCTNRDLPSRLPFGNQDSDFEMEGVGAMRRIVALHKPTQPIRPALGKSTLWRLISHLSLNYLSIVEGGETALQELLRLYDVGRTAYTQNVIQSIRKIASEPHFTRLISEQGVSFARGLHIKLDLDEDQFTGGGAFLFASVLERFFGMCASINSFTQLTVTTPQRKEGLYAWPPRSGRKPLT